MEVYEGRAVFATEGVPARWVDARHINKGVQITVHDTAAVLSVEQAVRFANLVLEMARTHPARGANE